MKSFACAALALFLSLPAFAAEVIARYDYNAGFSPRPGSEQLVIQSDGRVEFSSTYFDRINNQREFRRFEVARLNPELVVFLGRDIASLREEDLRDEQENEPRCTDVPSECFSVMKSGEKIAIGGNASCHHFVNGSPAASRIVSLLKGLVALARY